MSSGPSITAVRMSGARHREALPLLVLGPALGTSAAALWTSCAAGLRDHFDVLAWDLPGHGHNSCVPDQEFTVGELAAGVLSVVDDVLTQRGDAAGSFGYAGVGVGGAVGLQLLLDAPARLEAAVLLGTGARIGHPTGWAKRVEQVSVSGTAVLVGASAECWFAPGCADGRPDRSSALLQALSATDDQGYVLVCGALADFDVTSRLVEITAPVLAVAGTMDRLTPVAALAQLADGVRRGRLVELEDVAHLSPVEAPEPVAALIRQHLLGEEPTDPASSRLEDLVSGFVDQIEQAWQRPGLDRRSRSLIALTAAVAGGREDELAVQLRAAPTHGLSADEIRECLLQTAIHCGVPAASTAVRVARAVLDEEQP